MTRYSQSAVDELDVLCSDAGYTKYSTSTRTIYVKDISQWLNTKTKHFFVTEHEEGSFTISSSKDLKVTKREMEEMVSLGFRMPEIGAVLGASLGIGRRD